MAIVEAPAYDQSRRDFLGIDYLFSKRRSHGSQPPRRPDSGAFLNQPRPPDWERFKIRRRQLIIGGTVVLGSVVTATLLKPWEWLSHQSPSSPQSPTPEQPLNPAEQLSRIHQEIRRLALLYPEDSLVRKVYLGNVSDINPIFVSPLPVGFIDPVPYARNHFGRAEYTPNNRFRYFLRTDGSVADYATLQKQAVSISFSGVWLSSTNDQVKMLALEKEALQIGLWEPFSRIALNTYLSQGRVERLDPTVTDQEIANTFTRNLLIENADVRKMFEYAGYLAVLPKVGQLLTQGDPQITTEANYSNLPIIYELARRKGIRFEGLEFASTDFLRMAFDPNSPWVAMILDPSIPAPALPSP